VQQWNNRIKLNEQRATMSRNIKTNELHVQQWNNRIKLDEQRATMSRFIMPNELHVQQWNSLYSPMNYVKQCNYL